MPDKFAPLPAWVIPAIHFGFGWGGWVLLALAAVLAARSRCWRRATFPVAVILLVSAPLLAAGTGVLAPSRLPEAFSTLVVPLRMGYEVLFCILAVWMGTIWYRNNLGSQF